MASGALDLLATPRRRRWLFAALYFFEGAPIGFLWWALPVVLRDAGHPVDRTSALLAVVALPWAFKFVWAPLVDLLRGPRWTERGWIVCAQAVMAGSLLPIAVSGTGGGLAWLGTVLVVHAFAAATQDVAIDALAIRSSDPAERGRLNAWMNAGMLCGRAAFGSGALFAREHLSDQAVALVLASTLALGSLLALAYRPESSPGPSRARARRLARHLAMAFGRRATWFTLAFAAAGGAGFEAVGVLVGPFVLDAGASQRALAVFYAFPAWAAPVAGGLAAGRFADRLGHRRTVALASLGLALAVLALSRAAALGAGPASLFALLVPVYLGIGAFTASSYALFMDCTDPELGSTQFSAYMGATNLCESWSVAAGGRIAARQGYPTAFAGLALASLVALALLPRTERGGPARP